MKIFESQKDRETINLKQNEPETVEELTCCISCRYFGFRSELMMDGGNPTKGKVLMIEVGLIQVFNWCE